MNALARDDRAEGREHVCRAGIALTVGFEFYYTNISERWTYSDLMPLVPPFGTGLSPLLQWIFIPLAVVWLTQRQAVGAKAMEAGK